MNTVSEATLRPDHLLVSFLEELEHRAPDRAAVYHKEHSDLILACEDSFGSPMMRLTNKQVERTDWALEDLIDDLNDVAPDGTYFGSHIGDGACFGFWPVEMMEV